ncbi:MAG: hypothetical protein ABSB40_11280 [Nitrososphaeria archaeon]|jgi:hypothetical protein
MYLEDTHTAFYADGNPPSPLSPLFFDGRKINKKARGKGKFAKAYYWFRNDS